MIAPHPITLIYRTKKYLYLLILPLLTGLYNYPQNGSLLMSALPTLTIIIAVFVFAEWERRVTSFNIGGKQIIIKENLIFRSTRSFDISSVTSVEIVKSPFSRFFGASKVQIYTRGGKRQDEKKFIILKSRYADDIISKINIDRPRTLYKADIAGVILGAFSNSFTAKLLVILPVIQEVYDIAGSSLKQTLIEQLSQAKNLLFFIKWMARAISLLLIAVFIISVSLSIIRLWNFKVCDCGEFILIECGVFTRRLKYIRKSDIAAAEVFKTPIMHFTSRYCCKIYAMSQSSGDPMGHTLLLPCKREWIERFADRSGYIDNDRKGESSRTVGKLFYLLWRPALFLLLDILITLLLCIIFPPFYGVIIFTGAFFAVYLLLCGFFLIRNRKKLYIKKDDRTVYLCGRRKSYLSYVFLEKGCECIKLNHSPFKFKNGVSKITVYPKTSGRVKFHTIVYDM